MAKTLLNCLNEVSKRLGVFHGDTDAFTSLTSDSKQRTIDIIIQVVNEGIDDLYSHTPDPRPNMQAESTITLVTGTRAYSLATDLVRLLFPLRDETNNQYIYEHPKGYNQMLLDDPEQDDTGLPHTAAISPVDGTLHLSRDPTSDENGNIYKYQYLKDGVLSGVGDTVPFNDVVFRAMVPAWVCLYRRDAQKEFDRELYLMSIGRAARLLTQVAPRKHWSPRAHHGAKARFGFVVE